MMDKRLIARTTIAACLALAFLPGCSETPPPATSGTPVQSTTTTVDMKPLSTSGPEAEKAREIVAQSRKRDEMYYRKNGGTPKDDAWWREYEAWFVRATIDKDGADVRTKWAECMERSKDPYLATETLLLKMESANKSEARLLEKQFDDIWEKHESKTPAACYALERKIVG